MQITRIRALNFRCLRHVDVSLGNFQVLIGPNASGKSTFLDVLAFLGDLFSVGLDRAIASRSDNFLDLVWNRDARQAWFEFCIEFEIPDDLKRYSARVREFNLFEYAIRISLDKESGIQIQREQGCLVSRKRNSRFHGIPRTLFRTSGGRRRLIVRKTKSGSDSFFDETAEADRRRSATTFNFGAKKPALANLPVDVKRFRITTSVAGLVGLGLHTIQLDAASLRRPSSPLFKAGFSTGVGMPPWAMEQFEKGACLPWAVENFKRGNKDRFARWLKHLQLVIGNLQDIDAEIRDEDSHCYIVLKYGRNGELRFPSWVVSGGTLRFLALTLLAYWNAGRRRIVLVEEPENGIHPTAMQAVFDSLSSVHQSQILLTTHSPVFLNSTDPENILCFTQDDAGATSVVRGDQHPRLRERLKCLSPEELFLAGILG